MLYRPQYWEGLFLEFTRTQLLIVFTSVLAMIMSPSDEKSPIGKEKLADAATASTAFPHGTSVAATRGLEEAILTCTQKVEKIAKECRIANKKYRDFHFDLSLDGRYCLDGLTDEKPHLNPASTLRVGVRHTFWELQDGSDLTKIIP